MIMVKGIGARKTTSKSGGLVKVEVVREVKVARVVGSLAIIADSKVTSQGSVQVRVEEKVKQMAKGWVVLVEVLGKAEARVLVEKGVSHTHATTVAYWGIEQPIAESLGRQIGLDKMTMTMQQPKLEAEGSGRN